jgi:hypothetical protein
MGSSVRLGRLSSSCVMKQVFVAPSLVVRCIVSDCMLRWGKKK